MVNTRNTSALIPIVNVVVSPPTLEVVLSSLKLTVVAFGDVKCCPMRVLNTVLSLPVVDEFMGVVSQCVDLLEKIGAEELLAILVATEVVLRPRTVDRSGDFVSEAEIDSSDVAALVVSLWAVVIPQAED